jgi:hypothetical protein
VFTRTAGRRVQACRYLAVPRWHGAGNIVAIEPRLGASKNTRGVRRIAVVLLDRRLHGAKLFRIHDPGASL